MSYSDFSTKAEYKKYHSKVVKYIKEEYRDFHFTTTRNGTLLIQLAPIDKHHFHLLIGIFSDPKQSINNVAGNVVSELYYCLYDQNKMCGFYD